jgi:hypothetical protein
MAYYKKNLKKGIFSTDQIKFYHYFYIFYNNYHILKCIKEKIIIVPRFKTYIRIKNK